MPLTNHPISPKNKKVKNNSQIEKIAKFLNDSDIVDDKVQEENLSMKKNGERDNDIDKDRINLKSENIPAGKNIISDDKEKIDSRKEFFRLMAEKIKDKDFNINKAMAVKEEINKIEKNTNLDREDFSDKEILDTGLESGGDFEENFYDEGENEGQEQLVRDTEKPKSVVLYKKIVYRFLFLTLILLLVVSYLSFVKLDITINTEKNNIDGSLNFYAYSNGEKINLDRAIKASITKVEIEEKGVFKSSGEKDTGGEIVGRVKIINNYSKNQPLVATTRLLSSDDKLFRIKETVNIPAGGSIEVDVYADSVSEDMAIDPDKFIIPGLWIGVQDKIYAESYEKFSFVKDSKKYVMEKDINSAVENLKNKIIEQAEVKAGAAIGAGRQYVLSIDTDSSIIDTDKKIGEEADNFNVSVKSIVNVISFETDEIIELAKQKVSIETSQNISEIDANSLNYELVNFDSSKNLAEIKAFFAARTLVGSDDFIDKKHLSNLKEDQIGAYLDKVEEIKSYELNFTPKFIKRSPLLVDKINIEYR
ncbi:MAG: hypothetical protein WCY43_00090 [Patescibacteria group bacterium]|nr:hypothetical protein [Patescibacteria group bacterium]